MTLATDHAALTDALSPDAVLMSSSAPPVMQGSAAPRWAFPTRVTFRFFVAYFALYILSTQMYWGIVRQPWVQMPYLGANQTLRSFATRIATSWWGFPTPLSPNQGSGDKPYDWAHACALLIIAAAVTLLWSVIDRKRQSYPGVQKWFRLWLRLGLATTMASYGMAKAFPLQMSYPGLTRLLEPYGHFSLMGVLWAKIGASPAYEMFTGLGELAVAVLLFVPGLTTVGALLGLVVSSQIFVLNMTYDVPVKLFSFHLIVICLVLLAPDVRRMVTFLVSKRPADPRREQPLFRNRTAQRVAVAAQLLFGVWALWGNYQSASAGYAARGPNAPKPPLYGIWTIDRMWIDGVERAPLVTDYDRWRRLVIQMPTAITFQRMDDTFAGYGAKTDLDARTIALTMMNKPAGTLRIERPKADALVLDGDVQGRKIRIETTRFDHESLRLLQSRFRWFQDTPFNR